MGEERCGRPCCRSERLSIRRRRCVPQSPLPPDGHEANLFTQVYDPTETRLLISHASPGREGLLNQLCLVLKADLTISAGLHFRYGVSYNEFSVQHDPEAFKAKLEFAKKSFGDVWDTVKGQVEGVIECVLPPFSDAASGGC